MEEEDIYDDGITPQPSGLSALKSKFEKPATNKPTIGSRPVLSHKSANIAAKFGATSNAPKPVGSSVTGPDKVKPVIISTKSDPVTSNSSDVSVHDTSSAGPPSLVKRNSKLNIPAAFQQGAPPPPMDQKPQTPVKPAVTPKWKQKQDDSNNNKKTVTNSNVSHSLSNETTAMIDKEPKPNGLHKKPLPSPSPTGNVKEKAGLLFGGVSPGNLKSALKPVSARTQDRSPDSINIKPLTPKRIGINTGIVASNVELRNRIGTQIKAKRKSIKSIVRAKDNRKFHKLEVEGIKCDSAAPAKPSKLETEVDWEQLATDFKKSVKDLDASNEKSGVEEFEEEEEYDDIANVRRIVSEIPVLTEDEEREWQENGFEGLKDSPENLPPPPAEFLEPQEEYDDVAILMQNGAVEDDDELYEPLPDEPEMNQNETSKPPPPPPLEHIDKKESEKERKKREKEEKEKEKRKEKELKKKEDDLKQLMSKYKIDAKGLTQSVGKGTIRKTMKGTKKDVAVQQGDKVDIVRMVDNDKGKWLIRILNTDKDVNKHSCKKKSRRTVGYVDSTNVEVDTDIIRDVMEGSCVKQKFSSSSSLSVSEGDDEGETYEAVIGDEPIEEEIYEECN